jgi:hypothetical protein
VLPTHQKGLPRGFFIYKNEEETWYGRRARCPELGHLLSEQLVVGLAFFSGLRINTAHKDYLQRYHYDNTPDQPL